MPSFKGSSVLPIKLANMPDYSTLQREWSKLTTDEVYAFLKLRTDVFFLEQKIDETELDDELAELEQEQLDNKMLKTGTVPVSDEIHRLPAAANGERKSLKALSCQAFLTCN